MLAYTKKEEAENVADGVRYHLTKPVVLDGESYDSIVVAKGNGMGYRSVGVFAGGSLVVEGMGEASALASLIMECDNLKLRAVEKE